MKRPSRPAGARKSKATEPGALEVDGRTVEVSNLGKVLYPRAGFTKADVIDYYVRIAPVLLPHLKDRPITLKRYPDGVEGFFFYERHCPSHRPRWVKTARVPKAEGEDVDYCVIDGLPALVWAANLADLELHTFLHRTTALDRPTTLAFDLDPGPPANVIDCCEVALLLKQLFARMNLEAFPKTSGSKGLQVYVPLNTRASYDDTKAVARAVAESLQERFPGKIVAKMQKRLRTGKVLVDWSQNDDHKTTVTAYSLRAKERPTVSTPLHWREVEAALKKRSPKLLAFETTDVLRRVDKFGDLFLPVLTMRQKLPNRAG